MKRILFVDDEQHILDGLQNLLRRQRKQWEMVFARGAKAALAELETSAFDVIVSDMGMPGMDGPELLRRVKERHPAMARIILTGTTDEEAGMRALPVAHQFLDKPCDGEKLRLLLERTFALHDLLQDATIRGIVGKLDRLPSVPRTYWELTQLFAKAEPRIEDIARVVGQDVSMSVKLLQLVNSAYFGLARQLTSVEDAVKYLGMELVRGLTLSTHTFSAFEAAPEGVSIERLQESSLRTAKLGRLFLAGQSSAGDVFTAGLVHDVGRIILAVCLPDRFADVVRIARSTRRHFHVVEKEILGVTHAEVGGYLIGMWGLPLPIVEAITYHHSPSSCPEGGSEALAAVHVADAWIDLECTLDGSLPETPLDMAYLERHGFAGRLPKWRSIAEEALAAWREASA